MPIYWVVKNFTCLLSITYFFSPWQSSSKLALLMTYRKSSIHFTHMWFSAALGIAQTCLALLSLARKYFARQCQLGFLSFECCNRLCRLPEQELRVILCYACDWELDNCELIVLVIKHELSWIIRKLCHELTFWFSVAKVWRRDCRVNINGH